MQIEETIIQKIKRYGDDLGTSTRAAVAEMISEYDPAILFNTVSNYMNDSSVSGRSWIICVDILCELDEDAANVRFIEVLKTPDLEKKYRIIKALGGYGTEVILPTLHHMLRNEPDADIRFIIARTLGYIGSELSLIPLKEAAESDHAMNYEDNKISSAAMQAIKEIIRKNTSNSPMGN